MICRGSVLNELKAVKGCVSNYPHSFIQFIDGNSHKTDFLRFPITDFLCDSGKFDVKIGKNRFLRDRIVLDVNRENISIKGELIFSELTPFIGKPFSPGIMGPYSFVPFMECYHGLISVDHKVRGQLDWNNRKFKISDGRGYIEKDWGRSMPSSWIWIQSNIFDLPGTSFMLSIARIPWLGKAFIGYLAYFYHEKIFYTFATYNNSRYEIYENKDGKLKIQLQNRRHRLLVSIPSTPEGGELAAPVDGNMERTIRERTDSEVSIILEERKGRKIYEGIGKFCGIELTGNIETLK